MRTGFVPAFLTYAVLQTLAGDFQIQSLITPMLIGSPRSSTPRVIVGERDPDKAIYVGPKAKKDIHFGQSTLARGAA